MEKAKSTYKLYLEAVRQNGFVQQTKLDIIHQFL